MKVEIQEEGDLGEQLSAGDLTRPEVFSLLEQRQAHAIAAEVHAAAHKAQALGAGVFGFGAAVHRRFPNLWGKLRTRWNEGFRTLPVEVSVKARLSRSGLATEATAPR